MLTLTLFENRSGTLVPIPAAKEATFGPRLIDSLEIEYPYADIESFVEFFLFMNEFRAEHAIVRSALPPIYHRGRRISFERSFTMIEHYLRNEGKGRPFRVRISLTSPLSRPLIDGYLLLLEHRAKLANVKAAEEYAFDLSHPLFQPAANAEAHARIAARERLLEFFRSLKQRYFPDRGSMH